MDTRALADTLVRIVKVHNTDPSDIITEMETIFSAYGNLAQKGKESFGVSFLPVNRLNSVMILANSQPLAERALYWVRQLDSKTDLLANVHVYNVLNYKAKNLADILSQVYGGAPSAPKIKESKLGDGGGSFSTSALGAGRGPGGTGTGGRHGDRHGRDWASPGHDGRHRGGGLGMTGTGSAGGSHGHSGRRGRRRRRGLERAGRGPGRAPRGSAPKKGCGSFPMKRIISWWWWRRPTNGILFPGFSRSWTSCLARCLNEVLIAEVRLTDDLKYGIEFFLGGVPAAAQTSTGTQTTSNVPSGVLVAGGQQPTNTTITGPSGTTGTVSTAPATIPGVDMVSGASAAFTAAGGLTFVALDTANKLKGLINLLAAEGKVNILASPHIMAANNQEARIMIGEEVPILTSQSTAPDQPDHLVPDLHGAIPQYRHHFDGEAPDQCQGPGDPGDRPGGE